MYPKLGSQSVPVFLIRYTTYLSQHVVHSVKPPNPKHTSDEAISRPECLRTSQTTGFDPEFKRRPPLMPTDDTVAIVG